MTHDASHQPQAIGGTVPLAVEQSQYNHPASSGPSGHVGDSAAPINHLTEPALLSWEQRFTADGRVYFVDRLSGSESLRDPYMESASLVLYQEGGRSDGTATASHFSSTCRRGQRPSRTQEPP
ncbi:hypothetical protein NW767_006639 [Fusarium falciforme]|nr:hypothetical protein NW767_006639 [Fusarium falciforme]